MNRLNLPAIAHTLIDTSQDAVIFLNKKQEIVYANKIAEKYLPLRQRFSIG